MCGPAQIVNISIAVEKLDVKGVAHFATQEHLSLRESFGRSIEGGDRLRKTSHETPVAQDFSDGRGHL